eukprot:2102362-Rhodomonas_salina.1
MHRLRASAYCCCVRVSAYPLTGPLPADAYAPSGGGTDGAVWGCRCSTASLWRAAHVTAASASE